jgi:beta-lactamase superfamily II metal-dependent hydrolase
MINNDELRFHIINVGHGDAILAELPDKKIDGQRYVRFGLIDAGSKENNTEIVEKAKNYIKLFLAVRLTPDHNPDTVDPTSDMPYIFEFICLTHPHYDHLNGIMPVLETFGDNNVPLKQKPIEFWDCGFRYNTASYLKILEYLNDNKDIQFVRITSGTEFHFGNVEALVLAPSIDLRNRYDTYGVDANNASIILRFSHKTGVSILAGDAHFESWGKVSEEFPRKKFLIYPTKKKNGKVVLDERDPNEEGLTFLSKENQLLCHFLKVSHHGSKHGTSYEYLEKLSPSQLAVSCAGDDVYEVIEPGWKGMFPHPLVRLIIGEETDIYQIPDDKIPEIDELESKMRTTAKYGTIVYSIKGSKSIVIDNLEDDRMELPEADKLTAVYQ